jgi:hypothetical protein
MLLVYICTFVGQRYCFDEDIMKELALIKFKELTISFSNLDRPLLKQM